MEKYLNASCPICGTRYHVCMDCHKTRTFTPWKSLTDSINCYKIFMILNDHANKNSDSDNTKAKLQRCDLSHMASFEPGIQTMIRKILDKGNKHEGRTDNEK